MGLDLEELRDAVRVLEVHGRLERKRLDGYIAALAACTDRSFRFLLLQIGGLSGDRRFRPAMELAIRDTSDAMSARIALLGLCVDWGETKRYRDAVLEFARGVAWDRGQDVRIAALLIAGQYLKATDDQELLRALISATEARSEWVAQEAYQDLVRMLTGARYVPAVVDADERQRILAAAKTRLRGRR